MTVSQALAQCGPYELVEQRPGTLSERASGEVELAAEARYLVRLGEGASPNALRGALTVLAGATEGTLQFGNFVGRTSLGGRTLVVESSRIDAAAVERMLDQVAQRLGSLPFGFAGPTAVPYAPDARRSPEVLYHTYVLLRDVFARRGAHDLPAAMARILGAPHETPMVDRPRLTPLAHVSRIDAGTLAAVTLQPELLIALPAGSPLRSHPLARRLSGAMPDLVRISPLTHTTDNRENRFVVAVLERCARIARRFERYARATAHPAASQNAAEARLIASALERWRRHPVLGAVPADSAPPLLSTVMRGRAGYRELLRLHGDLSSRIRFDAGPADMAPLLEVRDAAQIYEFWCYFELVGALERLLGEHAATSRFSAGMLSSGIPYGYRSRIGEVELLYNQTFSRTTSTTPVRGRHSYSVRLRPDITLRTGGRLHLFDAKLKREFTDALDRPDAEEALASTDTFKREDLYKMHAYRDALAADSVWVLYPGSAPSPDRYPASWDSSASSLFTGVGAIALRPGAVHDGGLADLLGNLIEGSAAA
jgi:hypothetical protein